MSKVKKPMFAAGTVEVEKLDFPLGEKHDKAQRIETVCDTFLARMRGRKALFAETTLTDVCREYGEDRIEFIKTILDTSYHSPAVAAAIRAKELAEKEANKGKKRSVFKKKKVEKTKKQK